MDDSGEDAAQAQTLTLSLALYEQMLFIRRFETQVDILYRQGKIRGPAHRSGVHDGAGALDRWRCECREFALTLRDGNLWPVLFDSRR